MPRFFHLAWLSVGCFLFASGLFAEELRIATYNLNNYLVMDRMVAGDWRPDYPKPEREKEVLRRILKEVAPDILVLQEMGPKDFLEELRRDMQDAGLAYPYALHMQGSDSERHLAVLSKLAPKTVKKHQDLDFKYFSGREMVKRGLLEVSFSLPNGQEFRLFAVHLKSRYTDRKDDFESQLRRTREAEACRNRIIERTATKSDARYLVAGDFNDHPTSAPLRRFYRRGDRQLGTRVPAADSRGELWTYFYEKEATYSAIDGFIVSPDLAPQIKGERAHIVDSADALTASDHRMVYLDLLVE